MREVTPGDLIFSFVDTVIPALGIAESFCSEYPKPEEFGDAGKNWGNVGWRVRVRFKNLANKIRPKDHIELLRPLLPSRYSPIQANGNGLQSVYLAEVPAPMAEVLVRLIGVEAQAAVASAADVQPIASLDVDIWERQIEEQIGRLDHIPETERRALVRARIGQGIFRDRVAKIERRCRITKVDNLEHLRASHCKPWRDSTNEERLNGENGLMLTPSVDHLFDGGFIGFEDDGQLIISPVADHISLERMGIETKSPVHVGSFTTGQKEFLEFHRNSVLLRSNRA